MLIISLVQNYIDGSEFVALSEAEVKEIVPPIGLAKKILKLLPKVGVNLQSRICLGLL